MKGEDALRALVAVTARPDDDPAFTSAARAARVAGWMQGELGIDATSRQAAQRLRLLADCHLAARGHAARRLRSGRIKSYSHFVWSPTERGREVDAILERIRPARGGSFEPMTSAGITMHEVLALR